MPPTIIYQKPASTPNPPLGRPSPLAIGLWLIVFVVVIIAMSVNPMVIAETGPLIIVYWFIWYAWQLKTPVLEQAAIDPEARQLMLSCLYRTPFMSSVRSYEFDMHDITAIETVPDTTTPQFRITRSSAQPFECLVNEAGVITAIQKAVRGGLSVQG